MKQIEDILDSKLGVNQPDTII